MPYVVMYERYSDVWKIVSYKIVQIAIIFYAQNNAKIYELCLVIVGSVFLIELYVCFLQY